MAREDDKAPEGVFFGTFAEWTRKSNLEKMCAYFEVLTDLSICVFPGPRVLVEAIWKAT